MAFRHRVAAFDLIHHVTQFLPVGRRLVVDRSPVAAGLRWGGSSPAGLPAFVRTGALAEWLRSKIVRSARFNPLASTELPAGPPARNRKPGYDGAPAQSARGRVEFMLDAGIAAPELPANPPASASAGRLGLIWVGRCKPVKVCPPARCWPRPANAAP
ncbi:MAG: hypothetical protein U1F83_20360 [Verrucomicrobiota bacterium]